MTAQATNGLELFPGDVIPLSFTMNTGRSSGPKSAQITLTTEQDTQYSAGVNLTVKGTWSVTPDRIDFGDIEIGQTPEAPSRLVEFHSTNEQFRGVEVLRTQWLEHHVASRTDGRTELLFRVRPERLPPGVSSATAVIRTTSSVKPEGVIYISVRGVNRLNASVQRVGLLGAEPKVVKFTDAQGKPAALASVDAGQSELSVRIVRPSHIELSNPNGKKFDSVIPVTVTDCGESKCTIWVSSF